MIPIFEKDYVNLLSSVTFTTTTHDSVQTYPKRIKIKCITQLL